MTAWYKQTSDPTKRAVRRAVAWIFIAALTLYAIGVVVWALVYYPWAVLAVLAATVFSLFASWLFEDDPDDEDSS